MIEEYISVNKIAELKGLKSTRSIRLAIQRGKYTAREISVQGGKSYEIKYSSLEPEIQRILCRANVSDSERSPEVAKSEVSGNDSEENDSFLWNKIQDEKLENEEIRTQSTSLVPINNKVNFVSEKSRLTALARADIISAIENFRKKYPTKKEADSMFIELYNSGLYLPQVYKFMGEVSIGTIYRWMKNYENYGTKGLIPQRKIQPINEYNTILNNEMKQIFLNYLLHPNKFSVGKAIKLTTHILEKRGYENIPCTLTFRRFAKHFKKTNYSKWVLLREGEKAYHDKVEPYIERDISKIEVGDVLIADGHVLNFQVINPFTGKPTRATLVGFLDWKSTTLVGYEIMMSEKTQCIASALRNSILNLGLIPKVVYQDNGKAFKSKYFQDCDFEEDGFNGVYANLGIHSIFAKPYNARAKVIERFFLEFQEEFEKMMPSYIGTSIEDKPAWLKRGEKLHKEWHKKLTNNYIPTVQEVIKYINCWLEFHNSKPCPNDRSKSIQEMLNSVQKQEINKNILNDLMMKTECRTINKHGITFLNMHYRSDCILGLRDTVNIRYSLFDLSKIHVYSKKGEFLCVAHRVQKVHPMARVVGTVKDMEEYKQQYKKQQQVKNRLIKQVKKTFPKEELQLLEIEGVNEELALNEPPQKTLSKPKRERKTTPREQQMNKPLFNNNFEKYEWLMNNGCTNSEDRNWLTKYIRSEEYQNLYGD